MNAITAFTISAIAFSFYPLLNTIALETTSPFLLALCIQITTMVASALYLCVNLKSHTNLKTLFSSFWKLDFETKMIPVISGIGIYLGGIFFIFALSLMSKAGASLIMETWPILAMLIAPVLLNKDHVFSLLDFVLMLISLLGLLFITAAEANNSLEDFMNNPLFIFNSQGFEGSIGIIVAILSAFCLACSSVARSYFANILPNEFRINNFGKIETIAESNFTYLLTYVFGLPLAIMSYVLMEDRTFIEISSVIPIVTIGLVFVLVSVFYSYALLIAKNANINLIWYISPLLAAVWLALFNYSNITPMLILGGLLIIISNVILVITSKQKSTRKKKETRS
jgi:drug/metabolite transporter (DMT)-like permease